VVVLEAATGHEVSRLKLDDVIISPVTVDDENLYVLMADNQMVCFNKKDLSAIWQINGAQTSLSLLIQSYTQPIMANNALLTEFYSGQIVSVDPSGAPLWQIAIDSNLEDFGDMEHANLSSQMVVDGQSAFLASSSEYLSKINTGDGQILWKKDIADILGMNKFGNMLVTTTNGQEVVGLSDKNGSIAWVLDLTFGSTKYKTPYNLLTPFMANGLIYVVSSKGLLYEISTSGALLKTYDIPKDVKFYAVSQNKIYLFSKNSVFTN
jgi:outer membrane protein assembly factor BamB